MSSKSAGSELLSMMALVAAVVAAVILIFFGLGLPLRQALSLIVCCDRFSGISGEVDSPPPPASPRP